MRLKPTGEVEINVGVLVNNNEVLWEFREFLVELEAESDYKISMMLAKDRETILRVMSFIPGGFDIISVAGRLPSLAYSAFTDEVLKYNVDVRILFQGDIDMEFADGLFPHIMFVPNQSRLKKLTKEKIDFLIAEKLTNEEKENE